MVTPEMVQLQDIITAIVTAITMFGAIFFFVGLVVNFAQAQAASTTGDRIGYARAIQQAIAIVFFLSVLVSVNHLAQGLLLIVVQSGVAPETMPTGSAQPDALRLMLIGVANLVVSIVVGGSVMLTTVVAVYSGVTAQVAQAIGMPGALSQQMTKIGGIVLGGLATVLSVWGATTILNMVMESV